MEFRDAMKLFRSEVGIAQTDVAAALHINISTVARWEQGKTVPNRSTVLLLLDYAKRKSATSACMESLESALKKTAKQKLFNGKNSLFAVEHATISQIIEDADVPIYVCDLDTDEILYANRATGQQLGKSLDHLVGEKCYAGIMRRNAPCEFCHKNELTGDSFTGHDVICPFNGIAYRAQGKLARWNGRRAQVRYLLKQEQFPEARLTGAVNVAEAFTPMPKVDNGASTEKASAHSLESSIEAMRIKMIFENINGGVSVVAYEDNGALRAAYANDRYYHLFGYTKEQYMAELKGPHDTVCPEDWDKAAAAIAKVKETKQAVTFRYRIIKRDKSIAHLRCSSSVTSIEGESGYTLISILTDITESVQAEQQALVYGQRLDAIMKNMNSAVTASIVKSDGTVEFLFSNDLYHELLGYTKAQYQSEVHEPCQCIYPDDLASVQAAVFSLRSLGDAKELQYRVVTRDGKMKWLRARISMMTFPDAEGLVQLAVYSDITDIVEAQETISAQRDQIVSLLNDTPSGIAIIEVDSADIAGTMRTTYYNDRFITYSGYTRDEYDAILKSSEMSFVFEEDVPTLMGDIKKLCSGEAGVSVDSVVRCHTKEGGFRWLLLTGQLSEKRGNICVINIAMVDITKRQEAIDRQRINEEMLRIAAETDQRSIIVYDVKKNTCRAESRTLFSARYGEVFENIPQSLLDMGLTSPDSADEFCSLFARIRNGEKKIHVSLQMHSGPDTYEWFDCNASTIFDADGLPDHAVLAFHNVAEQRIKEAVFRKWQQSIDARPLESYSLFRVNLSRDASLDDQHGNLLQISIPSSDMSFNNRAAYYAEECIYPDDREKYVQSLDADMLLAMFYRGDHFASLDYRETAANGETVWRRLTVEMVEYPNSKDVQAFLMYEDIDVIKKAELAELELAKSDPLTGALNRGAFVEQVDEVIGENPNANSALIMLDMDGFKQLNDTFGHAAGDQALQDVASVLRSYARSGDLVCRLGGDEFLVWLRDIPYDAVIGKIAQQMCEHIHKAYGQDVLISASVGIAVYPRDGQSYDELYHCADKALYKVKQAGKGSYAFFSVIGEEQTEDVERALATVKPAPQSLRTAKRRILVVDDNEINRITLKNIFKDEYLIETAKNGAEAMIRMRHFGASISVVLLDLLMPGVDGFAVLRKMQGDDTLRTIPVIVVTGDEKRDTLLKAFELGAAEYVAKPVDVDIIRMRVKSVISKAESERLRAQNSYLMLQRNEEAKYRTVLESTGTAVVEYDWRNHVYTYDDEIAKHIAGSFDHRGLWQVFLSDMVAESADVKALQDMLIRLGSRREQDRDTHLVMLKTPRGARHWFRVNFYKNVDDFGLAEKMIITFNDVHDEVLANDKLRFQATRDELTGLYNRAGFLEKAAEMISASAPGYYVMACIDVEKFQVINDRYGPEKGDDVLKHIAASVGGFVAHNNGICCRYTADRFAVLYPAKLLGTAALAENHRIASSPDCLPRPLRLRIGRCMVSETSLPVSAMFDRATMAEALAKGRYDTYIVDYDESMRDNILKEQQIAFDMVDALQNGEFEPWFQPQYNHATGALIGAEALVRWRKDGEIIPPSDFIPVFEKNGFIYEVDQSIWRQVCALLRRWLDEGKKPLPVSVNISRHDMLQENIVDVLTDLVAAYRLPVELLRLEITESAFSDDTNTVTGIAGQLIAAGFTVEIDDFGSGYSSLNTLKDVPASILKLDMRFFERTGDANRGGNIVESVVRMAKWLGMAVIAEGVEDKAQADYLKSIGCIYIQGYFYAKPMTTDEYEKRLNAGAQESTLTHLQTMQNLDNNEFWDSHSMDTLIFNTYVGAACILELFNGKVEMVRATEHYVRMLGSDALDIQSVLDIDWMVHMDERNVTLFTDAVSESLDTKEPVVREFEFHGLPGCPDISIIRSTLRVIATAGEHILIYCLSENMTAQRMAERAALNASERTNAVMNHSHCGISAVIARPDGTVDLLFVNNRFFEMLGYTREQYMAEVSSPYDRVVPEDRERVFEIATTLTEIGATASLEVREMRRDGSIVWLRWDASVVQFANVSEPVQLANFMDITAQKDDELKQLESAHKLEVIMSNVNGGISAIYLKKDRPEYALANEQYYRTLGYTKEEFEAENINSFDLLHPDDREWVMEKLAKMQHDGDRYTMEYRIIRRDGAVRHILCNISVLKMFGTDVPLQLAVISDITELREAQRQELAVKDRLNAVMDATPNGMTAVAFHDDGPELLFTNNRFFELHGIRRDDCGKNYLAAAIDLVLPEYRETIHNAFSEAERTWQSVSYDCQIRRPDGVVRWLRVIINMTRLVGIDVPVRVAVFSDITDEKEAAAQLRFLNDSAHDILTQSDSEGAIQDTLTNLVAYFSADRAYVIELDEKDMVLNNTYEICADGVEAEIESWQSLPYAVSDYWYEPLSRNDFFIIDDVSAMDDSRSELREMLLEQDIRSLILAPVCRDGRLIAFAGVDNPKRAVHQLKQLRALADYCTALLTRRDLLRKIEHDSESVRQLMDDTPGGFVRMELFNDRNPSIVTVNNGICKMLGMTKDELIDAYGSNVFACLADDDAAVAADEIAAAYASGGQYTSTCRLRRKDGSLFWVMLFGRFVHGEAGHLYLNAFFTDITEQRNVEQLQTALLDNLPFGAAMYEFDGKSLKALHINRQYQIIVGRTRNSATTEGFSPTDFIHPDDRSVALNAIRDAIANRRDAGCNIRVLYGEDEYRFFHIDARIMAQPNGKYLVYAAYTRLSEQELTFENALPHMFSTIMESSTDLAFAKDVNFRYICCSRTFAMLLGLASEDEVVGKTDYELFPREIADMFRRDDSSLFATQRPQIDIEEMLPSPNGTKHYIRTSKHLLRNDTDAVIGIYCTGRDITEVQEAYARLRLLTDSIPGGIATFRCSPGKIETLYFNEGICALAGYSREEYTAHPVPILDLVFAEDMPIIRKQIELLQSGEKHLSFTVRIHTKTGGYKWISNVATLADNVGKAYIINAVLTDVTTQQEEKERLRLAEEEYRIATEHSAQTICRYNIADRSLKVAHEAATRLALPLIMQDVPYSQIEDDSISSDTVENYLAFYEGILRGKNESTCVFCKKLRDKWRWLNARSTSIFDLAGKPVSAIISFRDITEEQEKEIIFKKWEQSLTERNPAQFTLYRCNLSKDASYDTREGRLFGFAVEAKDAKLFNECTAEFCGQYVVEDDRSKYLAFLDSDRLLANYYRGVRSCELLFRAKLGEGTVRWIRLSVELLEYPDSTDVEAYLMYEDINDSVLEELHIKKLAETDTLTGLQNRKVFIEQVTGLIEQKRKDSHRALFLLDIDGFKQINDTFGHGIGDESIVSMAGVILSVIKEDGLVCRLGGDEFLVYLPDMPSRDAIADKARALCEASHITIKQDIQLSVSIGVALFSDKGENFDSMYHKADKALYHVKGHGKNNFAFYDADMERTDSEVMSDAVSDLLMPLANGRNTMLIVDDSAVNRLVTAELFKKDFSIAEAENGQTALNYLRIHSGEVAIVLLDIMMPVMDGYQLLAIMSADPVLQEIPVIVISGEDDRKASLRAIQAGASDYVVKPIDIALLRLRISSALSKSENERLRKQYEHLSTGQRKLQGDPNLLT